jgi:hypothetical protein
MSINRGVQHLAFLSLAEDFAQTLCQIGEVPGQFWRITRGRFHRGNQRPLSIREIALLLGDGKALHQRQPQVVGQSRDSQFADSLSEFLHQGDGAVQVGQIARNVVARHQSRSQVQKPNALALRSASGTGI